MINPTNNLPPFKYWCLKVLPAVYDDSLSYYELLCKVVAQLNTTINAVNNNGDAVTELQQKYTEFTNNITEQQNNFENSITEQQNNYEQQMTELYNELKSYVDNYFTNLDVQNEINNKLDAMVQDGTFENILNNTIFPEIQAQLNNQKYFVTPEDFGAKGDGVTDDSEAINNAIQSLENGGTIYFQPKTYAVGNSILINKRAITLLGSFSTLHSTGTILKALNTTTDPLIFVNSPTIKIIGGSLKNIALYGSDERYTQTNSVNRIGLSIKNVAEFHLENVNINGFYNEGLKADQWWDSCVYNLQLTACGNLQYNKYAMYLTSTNDSTNSIKFTSCHFEFNNLFIHIDNLASHIHFNECKFEKGNFEGDAPHLILIDEGVYTIIFNNCFFAQNTDTNPVFSIKNNYTIITSCAFQAGVLDKGYWINHNGNGNNTGNGLILSNNNFYSCSPTNAIVVQNNAIIQGNIISLPSTSNNNILINQNALVVNNIFKINGNTNTVIKFAKPTFGKSSFKNNDCSGFTNLFLDGPIRNVDKDIKIKTISAANLTSGEQTINADLPYSDYFCNGVTKISKITGGNLGDEISFFVNKPCQFTCGSNRNNITIASGGSITFKYVDTNLKWWVKNFYKEQQA